MYSVVDRDDSDVTSLSWKVVFRKYFNVFIAALVILATNAAILTIARPTFKSPETGEIMTWQPYVVMNAVAVSIFLMAIGLPADLILMCVSGAFCVFRIIDTNALLEGLSNGGVVAVAVLCVVSKAVDKTKALNGFMSVALGHPNSIAMAMVRMAIPVIGLGTVFNNTPLVAVMIPIVKTWTDKIGFEASYFMMPLSFFSMLSACFTTMGSSTNLLAVDLVPKADIQFCDLTPVGFFVMATGVAYCALLAPVMLPSHDVERKMRGSQMSSSPSDEAGPDPERYTVRLQLEKEGPLLSYTAAQCGIQDCLPKPASIRCVRGAGEKRVFKAGDEIELENATADDISSLLSVPGITFTSSWLKHRSSSHLDAVTRTNRTSSYVSDIGPDPTSSQQNWIKPVRKWIAANVNGGWKPHHRPLFEVVIAPGGLKRVGRASFVGAQSLSSLQAEFSEYNLTLIAFRGMPEVMQVTEDIAEDIRLEGGEVLLVEALVDLPASTTRSFRMVLPVAEGSPPAGLRLSPLDPLRPVLAVLGLVACVVLSAFRIVPLDALAILVGLESILVGTLNAKEFYGAINGPVLLTVAASFGLGTAFAKTGVASFLAETVLGVAEKGGPFTVLGSIVGLALTLGVVVSNNTTVILLAPLVEDICERKGLNLKMMMLAVVYAANLSFATPFSYQTNMMVMPHGGYVFMDYVKFGIPMMLICGIVAVIGTHVYWG